MGITVDLEGKKRFVIFFGLLQKERGLYNITNRVSGFCIKKAYEIFSGHFDKELSAVPNLYAGETDVPPDDWHELADGSIDGEAFKELILDVINRWKNGEFSEEEKVWAEEVEKFKANRLSKWQTAPAFLD